MLRFPSTTAPPSIGGIIPPAIRHRKRTPLRKRDRHHHGAGQYRRAYVFRCPSPGAQLTTSKQVSKCFFHGGTREAGGGTEKQEFRRFAQRPDQALRETPKLFYSVSHRPPLFL